MDSVDPRVRITRTPAVTAAAGDPPPLHADRREVHPKAVRGTVRRAKWAILALCLGLCYLVPWLRRDRGPGVPDQAVPVDMQNARLFFLWIEIWPQEVYFLAGLPILAAVALFAVSSPFGRLWCGFACPQTVWTDLFTWVERLIEGGRTERMRLDRAPWTPAKYGRKAAKHAARLAIPAAAGGAWIMRFRDAPTVAAGLPTGRASLGTYFFFGLFTATTYVPAGWAREQVCTYMCPWPRFQAAMPDENSLVVTYRAWRGEPRGKAKDAGAGDCVDCRACAQVCPTGIDIRDGLRIECIGCGLCIDACDGIMGRLGRPKGLIGFGTPTNLAASAAAAAAMRPGPERLACGMAARKAPRFARPRTPMYGGAPAAVALVMPGAFLTRETPTLTALRDRAPLHVRLADGGLRNACTLKLANKTREAAPLALAPEAPAGLRLAAQDAGTDAAGRPLLATKPDGITRWRVFVTAPAGWRVADSTPVAFRLPDASGREAAREGSVRRRLLVP